MPITSRPVEFFGHKFITRKILSTFLDFLSRKIYVERYDENGDILKFIKPPVHFSNRSRFIALSSGSNQNDTFNTSNTTLDLNYILPRMSVSISGMNYSAEKKLVKSQRIRAQSVDESSGSLSSVLSPVPYQLTLELSILTRSIDDTFQIIEQLVPYFAPTLSFDVKILDGFNSESIPFTLTSISPDSNDEYGVTQERIFLSTLSFETLANYYYIKRSDSIIKQIIADFYVAEDEDYIKIKRYELNADNLAPVTTVASREDEDMTKVITEYQE